MTLNTYIHSAGSLEEGRSNVSVVGDFRVCVVVDNDDIIILGKLHRLVEELHRGNCAGRVVRVSDKHQFCIADNVFRDGIIIRKEVVLL